AVAAEDHVVSGTGFQTVAPRAAVDEVIAFAGENHIVTVASGHYVVAASAREVILPLAAGEVQRLLQSASGNDSVRASLAHGDNSAGKGERTAVGRVRGVVVTNPHTAKRWVENNRVARSGSGSLQVVAHDRDRHDINHMRDGIA